MENLPYKSCVAILWASAWALAATPTARVDFDMAGRSSDQVTEPGYTAWPVTETASASLTASGVTFTVSRHGSAGTAIKTDWYKAGIDAPYYARLVSDGLTVVGGNAGGSIQLVLSGLPTGKHTLLTWLNTTNGYQHAGVDITVNGTRVATNLSPTNRATTTAQATASYIGFDATAGQSVTIVYSPNASSTSSYKNVVINGFALNTPNSAKQAQSPIPTDRDLHVNADQGSLTLQWTPASGATSHDVYLGTDSASVASATPSSSLYLGNQTTTSRPLSNLSNLKTYYWRVDEKDASGTTQGSVWRFSPRHLAFPGAEGYGRYARGGRGGKVVHVTNLNDAGAGSLREAIESDIGPRTVVFDVSGIIKLASRLTVSGDHITIAGQTAPGKGIVIRGAPFGFSGVSDGIMRFVRVRLGAGQTYDGTGLQGSDYCIFDHNSISWTIDEAFSSRSGKHITLQKTLIAEALNAAGHQNYPAGTQHGYAGTISGDTGSFHHNLLAHNEGRNWSLGGGLDANGYFAGNLDIFNNVVYNWGGRTTDGGAHQVNFVNNYYKTGPASEVFHALKADFDNFPGTQQYYCKGNIVTGKYTDTTKIGNGCVNNGNPDPWVSAPFFPSYATIHSAQDAYKHVLSDVGATQPVFDDHDKRIIKETWNGTYTYKGSVTGKPGLPDSETDVGGYESYPASSRPAGFDTDGDGMPDWWEKAAGVSDPNADSNNDGYTNLEDYLNWLALPHAVVDSKGQSSFNLAELSRGFQNGPAYTIATSSCATASLKDSVLTVTSKGTCKLFSLDFTVKDGQGSSLRRSLALLDSASQGTSSSSSSAAASSSSAAAAPVITKYGAGSSSQNLVLGSALAPFYFGWTNASTVTVSGLPGGVDASVDNTAKTVSFSGTPTAAGIYTYTITTVGGSTQVTRSGTLTITTPSSSSSSALSSSSVGSSSSQEPSSGSSSSSAASSSSEDANSSSSSILSPEGVIQPCRAAKGNSCPSSDESSYFVYDMRGQLHSIGHAYPRSLPTGNWIVVAKDTEGRMLGRWRIRQP